MLGLCVNGGASFPFSQARDRARGFTTGELAAEVEHAIPLDKGAEIVRSPAIHSEGFPASFLFLHSAPGDANFPPPLPTAGGDSGSSSLRGGTGGNEDRSV
jgi:hypothetical protein